MKNGALKMDNADAMLRDRIDFPFQYEVRLKTTWARCCDCVPNLHVQCKYSFLSVASQALPC